MVRPRIAPENVDFPTVYNDGLPEWHTLVHTCATDEWPAYPALMDVQQWDDVEPPVGFDGPDIS